MAIILATLMLLTAAPLSGFVGMEWPELNLPDWTLSQSDKVTAFHDTADAAVVNQSGVIDTKDLIAGDEDGLTRVEWLHNITVLFDMTVHENNIPDNYFADLSSDSEYYYDILLAVEFGVVDIPAGGEVLPEDPATRDFAASTLNFCLGFVLEEEEYTFSDIDAVSNAQHAQIAINRGWFELIDGAFSPETPVTASEVEAMIADATEVIEGSVVGESTENYIVFADFVKELDKTTVFEYNENGDVVLYDYEGEDLAAGDVIALYGSELPSVYTVTSVTTETATEEVVEEETEEEIIEIITLGVEFYEGEDSAVLDMVAEGTMDVDLNQFEAAEGITYDIVTDGPVRVGGISYKNGKLLATKDFKLGSGVKVDFSFELSNLKTPINVNIKKGIYQIEVVGDVKINCTGKINTVQMAGLPSTVTIGYVNIAGIGKAEVTVNIALAAQLSFTYTGKLSAGIQYKNSSFRLISRFEKANFCCVLEVDGSVELMFNVGINLAGVLKGNIYAKAGMKGKYTNVIADGTGINCVTIEAWMIASVGANASLNLLVVKKEFSKNHTIFDKSNSPIRVNLHYEDGVQVFECSKDKAGSEGGTGGSGGSGGTGSSGSKQYVSPPTTRYGASGSRNVSSTSTYGGEVYTHYDYTLDSNNNATITKYYGNASALILPETIDGYTVTTIGSNVFKNNKNLYSVFIPDTVTTIGYDAFLGCTNLTTVQLSKNLTSIGSSAFSGCTNLNSIQLPASLVEIGYNAFYNCDSLTSINIPKSLTTVTTQYSYNDLAAPFADCDNLKSVEFEEGITSIAAYLFQYCSGLENIIIPNTVTTIGSLAFVGCSNLKSVQLSADLTSIGEEAFYSCASLSDLVIPDKVTSIKKSAFQNCSSLKTIVIPKSVNSLGTFAFYGCSALETATLPSQITSIPNSLFSGCSSLKTIAIPNTVKTIGSSAFANCKALENFTFPNGSSVETINSSAFSGCESLTEVRIPDGVKTVSSYAFQNCTALEKVSIPQSVKTISNQAFIGCEKLANVTFADYSITTLADSIFMDIPALKEIVLPKGLTTISNQAFRNCTGLVKITIPASVTSIVTNALSYPDKTVICGVKGSYAETFATENGFQFVDIGVPAQGFSLKDGIESIDLEAGEKFIAEFEFFPADSTDCISMKAGSSAVSVAGMELTAKSKGSTVVTATTTSGLTYEFTVNVRTVKNIQVTQMPTKTTFKLGEELDLTGMVLTVNYSDNTTKQVTDYTVSGYNNSVEGENKITIKWIALNGSSYSTTLTLNIVDPNPKVTGIVIDTLPVKTVYNRGESLDLTGLVVTANYTDGSSAVITDYTVSGYNALKYDAQTITVTYKEFTATFTVTVTRPHTCTAGDWEIITPATCTAVGTKVQKCAECGTVMATQEIPALGHDYVGTITTQPTCTTKGVKTYTCANCGDTYTEELAELGHTPGAAVTEDKIEATCTEDGAYNMVVYCATCGEKLSTTPYTITAFGHTPGADATCTEDQTCTVCGEILTAKLGHTPGADATCTEDQVCTVCGEILTAKLGHDYDSVVTAPTCEEDGFTTYTCANCADTYVADETAAIGHSWDEGIVTTEPTTETDGVMTYTCTVCSETKTETIEKLQGSFTESEDAVITEDGNICTMVGKTAESLLAQAGAAATLVDKKGNTLTADAKVGTGAVLTLADGTQYEIIVPGDCDGDAAITSGDARFALRYSVGLEDAQAGTVYAAAADVDTAAGVAAGDARAILRASVGLDNPDEWFEKLR